MMEQCSGRSGALQDIVWYQVPGTSTVMVNGQSAEGYWNAAERRMVVASTAVLDGGTIRHEMLHALLGVHGHPRSQFLGTCAGLVTCADNCVADAGLMPIPSDGVGGLTPVPDA
jgi:hypothetical protein